MDQQTTNFFTTTISLYGAVVSTISFIIALGSVYIAWLAYHRDNSKIKIKVTDGVLLPAGLHEGGKTIIDVINRGRRPVVITNVGFLLNNGHTIISLEPFGARFPHELTEGKSCTVIYDQGEVTQMVQSKKAQITHAWADDATGKRHTVKYNFYVRKR